MYALKVLNILDPKKLMVGLLNMVRAKVVPFNLFGTCTQIPQQKCQWIGLIMLLNESSGYERDTLPKTNIAPETW